MVNQLQELAFSVYRYLERTKLTVILLVTACVARCRITEKYK